MYIRIWDESQFLAVLDSGLYEDLIKQVECWLEEGYVVTRSRVPSDLDYAQARRAIALATIAQEGHNIWQADRSNYYDNYAKIINRIEEKRKKGLIYKVKRSYVSSSSSYSSSSSSTSSSTSSSSSATTSSYSSSQSSGSIWPTLIAFLLVIAVGVFLWFEVFTVRVSMVTDKTVVSEATQRTTYEYDKQGKLITVAEVNEDGVITSCTHYEYDSIGEPQGCVTHIVENGVETVASRSEYEANPFFYIMWDQQMDANNQKTNKIWYRYNFSCLLQETTYYEGKDAVRGSTYEYDKKLPIKQVDYDYVNDEKREVAVYEYTYNDDGLIAEEIRYVVDANGENIPENKLVYEYDSNGYLQKITEYLGEDAIGYTQIKCDEQGRITETAHYNANAETANATVTYQYEEFRMRATKAKRFQRERGEEFVIIDKGLF